MAHDRVRFTRWALQGLLGLCLFAWVLRPIWGIDVFFHVAIGRYIVAHGLPTTDVFSAADPAAPWTPFQSGYALLVAALDAAGGLDALRVAHAILIAIAAAMLAARLRAQAGVILTVCLFPLFLLLFDDRIRLRPHVVNLGFEVAFLLPLAAGRLSLGGRRGLLVVALLAFGWSAMHAMGALWLTAVLGVCGLFGPIKRRRFHRVACAVSGIALALAPGSLVGIVHVLRIQDRWKEFVPELAPSWAFFGMGDAYGYLSGVAPWVAVAVVLAALACRPSADERASVVSAAGFAFGAVWLARLGYYSVFAIALCVPTLREAATRRDAPPASGPGLVVSALSGLVLLGAVGAHVLPRFTRTGVNPWTTTLYPGAFPEREVDAMATLGIEGRVYNELRWGGYLLYRLFPRVRVLGDGRITFGPDVAELFRREGSEPGPVLAEVAHRRFGVDLLVWRRGRLAPNSRWRLLVEGPVAQVWGRVEP